VLAIKRIPTETTARVRVEVTTSSILISAKKTLALSQGWECLKKVVASAQDFPESFIEHCWQHPCFDRDQREYLRATPDAPLLFFSHSRWSLP
jgi:hypothetical protein